MTADRVVGGRVRTVFAGSGGFGRATLRALASLKVEAPAQLVGVVTAPPRPAGRSARPTPTPIGALAAELGLEPVLTPERLRDPAAVADLLELRPDLLVVADFGQIVPPALLELPHGALDLHPSRLPRHRGASPIPATILAGDPDTAVSLIRMDAAVDTGPIVSVSEPVEVPVETSAPELEAILEPIAAELLVASLGPWLAGEIEPLPQSDEGATMTRRLRREDGRLDPERPAFLLERAVRAYRPWPGTFLETDRGERIAVLRAGLDASRPGDLAGRFVADAGGLALATSDGRLRLLEVQPPGRRPMSGDAFLRGRPGFLEAGAIVPGATMADR
ncbi:MAG TPA: methionyl-tRNA formyltransferase [Candidatus Limnocylindrales bacterium]|nr:methionyl-tRNA formyltransferase [Candidatus Limnocylindrales bacterium]